MVAIGLIFSRVRPYRQDFRRWGANLLLPVEWPKGGWPMILPPNKRVPLVGKSPNNVKVKPSLVMPVRPANSHGETISKATLFAAVDYAAHAESAMVEIRCSRRPREIEPRTELLSGKGNPSFLCRRVQHQGILPPKQVCKVPKSAGVSAGLVAVQNDK